MGKSYLELYHVGFFFAIHLTWGKDILSITLLFFSIGQGIHHNLLQ